MIKVLGMGNALVDVLVVMENDKLLDSLSLPKGSMQLIDEETLRTLTSVIESFDKKSVAGGSASNTIVGLARLGIYTGFIGRIGEDVQGNDFKQDLLAQGVHPHLSEVDEASGVATTFISQDGERTFGTYLGAAALLAKDDLEAATFAGYDYFYIEGYLMQNHLLISEAIRLAKEAKAKVVLDLASYNVVEENREFLLSIIAPLVDIIFANEEEARSLLSMEAVDAVSALAQHTSIAIVKTGDKGSWIQQGTDKVFVPAHSVECIDTTGAGDLYAAGFLYGLIHGYPLTRCGEIGTSLAAEVIQVIGAKIDDARWIEIRKRL